MSSQRCLRSSSRASLAFFRREDILLLKFELIANFSYARGRLLEGFEGVREMLQVNYFWTMQNALRQGKRHWPINSM
jgi:hypothetical protein